MKKHVNLVDLFKSFPTNIFLQNLASIQMRASPIKFAYLAEKSEKGSISNLSTKAPAWRRPVPRGGSEPLLGFSLGEGSPLKRYQNAEHLALEPIWLRSYLVTSFSLKQKYKKMTWSASVRGSYGVIVGGPVIMEQAE